MFSTKDVKNRLESAAYVDKMLPKVGIAKYKACMPEIAYTPQEVACMERLPMRVSPTKEQIEIWEMVNFEWMPILEPDERKLVWKRANRIPWKLLCRDFGYSRSQLTVKYELSITKIAVISNSNLSGQISTRQIQKNVL